MGFGDALMVDLGNGESFHSVAWTKHQHFLLFQFILDRRRTTVRHSPTIDVSGLRVLCVDIMFDTTSRTLG